MFATVPEDGGVEFEGRVYFAGQEGLTAGLYVWDGQTIELVPGMAEFSPVVHGGLLWTHDASGAIYSFDGTTASLEYDEDDLGNPLTLTTESRLFDYGGTLVVTDGSGTAYDVDSGVASLGVDLGGYGHFEFEGQLYFADDSTGTAFLYDGVAVSQVPRPSSLGGFNVVDTSNFVESGGNLYWSGRTSIFGFTDWYVFQRTSNSSTPTIVWNPSFAISTATAPRDLFVFDDDVYFRAFEGFGSASSNQELFRIPPFGSTSGGTQIDVESNGSFGAFPRSFATVGEELVLVIDELGGTTTGAYRSADGLNWTEFGDLAITASGGFGSSLQEETPLLLVLGEDVLAVPGSSALGSSQQLVLPPIVQGASLGNVRVADAGADQTGIAEGSLVSLGGLVSDPDPLDGGNLEFSWTVENLDGAGGPVSTPFASVPGSGIVSHSFTPDDQGTWLATLVVNDLDAGTTYTDRSRVFVENVIPTVSFTTTGALVEGQTISILPTTFDPVDPVTAGFIVSRDGETFASGLGGPLSFTPDEQGDYTVTVVALDGDGGTGFAFSSLTVANAAPDVDLGPDQTVSEGALVEFLDVASDVAADTFTSILWEVTTDNGRIVPDATTESFQLQVLEGPATYTVTATFEDEDGGIGSDTVTITVDNVAPTVALPDDFTVTEGDPVVITPGAFDPGTDALTFTWTVLTDNGQVVPGSTEPIFEFVPEDEGIYTVSLSVSDGTTSTVEEVVVTSTNRPPELSLDTSGLSATLVEGDAIAVDAIVGDAGTTGGIAISWVVERGGQPFANGTGTSIVFTPTDEGAYLLTVSADDGTSPPVDVAVTFDVVNGAPLVDLGPPPVSVVEGGGVAFAGDASLLATDPGSEDVLAYEWFVDGSLMSSDALFTLPATVDGSFVVTLVATDGDGGTSFDDVVVTVDNAPPSLSFTDPGPQTEDIAFQISGNVSDVGGDAVEIVIDFGDGTEVPVVPDSGGDFVAQHVYADPSTYTILVTARDADGGVATEQHIVNVADVAPNPDINRDGTVDAFDIEALRGLFYSDQLGGDLNEDGFVNAGDLQIVVAAVSASAASATAPDMGLVSPIILPPELLEFGMTEEAVPAASFVGAGEVDEPPSFGTSPVAAEEGVAPREATGEAPAIVPGVRPSGARGLVPGVRPGAEPDEGGLAAAEDRRVERIAGTATPIAPAPLRPNRAADDPTPVGRPETDAARLPEATASPSASKSAEDATPPSVMAWLTGWQAAPFGERLVARVVPAFDDATEDEDLDRHRYRRREIPLDY